MSEKRPPRASISVVVPVLDEEECVEELARRVSQAAERAGVAHELLFVDDGSRDRTAERIEALHASEPAVKLIRLTRTFGHQAALAAGLGHASGDAVVTMDGDLQHPPECIPGMVGEWRKGAQVVHAIRRAPHEQRFGLKEVSGRLFERLLAMLSRQEVIGSTADFRLLDRRAVDQFNDFEEHFLFVRGLVPWMGFRQARIEYDPGDRFAGQTKYSPQRMLRLALDGIFSFSVMPLRLISLLGLATTLFGVCFGIFSVVSWALGRVEDTGWTSIVVLILVFGGVQLLSIGIVSEYIGRTYEEVKRRPRYVIASTRGLDDS